MVNKCLSTVVKDVSLILTHMTLLSCGSGGKSLSTGSVFTSVATQGILVDVDVVSTVIWVIGLSLSDLSLTPSVSATKEHKF